MRAMNLLGSLGSCDEGPARPSMTRQGASREVRCHATPDTVISTMPTPAAGGGKVVSGVEGEGAKGFLENIHALGSFRIK